MAEEIKKHLPDFQIHYKPDFRQDIADTWPQSIEDKIAQRDWGLQTEFDLEKLTSHMLEKVKEKLTKQSFNR